VNRLVAAALQIGDLARGGVRGRVLAGRAGLVRGSGLIPPAPVLNFASHSGQGSRRAAGARRRGAVTARSNRLAR
jgi:hypothetical protein